MTSVSTSTSGRALRIIATVSSMSARPLSMLNSTTVRFGLPGAWSPTYDGASHHTCSPIPTTQTDIRATKAIRARDQASPHRTRASSTNATT